MYALSLRARYSNNRTHTVYHYNTCVNARVYIYINHARVYLNKKHVCNY